MPKKKNPGKSGEYSSNTDETALKEGNEETGQIESPRGSAQSESSGDTEQLEASTLKAPDKKGISEKNLMEETGSSPFLLNEWMNAIERLKKTDPKTYREVEEYANKEWASHIADELEVADEPLELLNNYLDFLSSKGIISRKDFASELKGEDIVITISGKYQSIIRGGNFFTYLIELVSGKIFDYEEKSSGNSIKLVLSPGVFTLKVAIAMKVGRGSIKVSSKDLGKLDMDIIENVTLLPVGKETGIAEMMSSDSKVSAGFVIMNARDANLIGVREGDKVELIKKEDENAEEKGESGESGQEKESGDDTGGAGHEEGEGNQPKEKEEKEEGVGKWQQKEDGETKNEADSESNKETPGEAEKETAAEEETLEKEQDKEKEQEKEQNDDEQQEEGDLKNEETGAKSQPNSEISSQSKNPIPAKGAIAQKPKQQRSQVQAQKQKQQPKQQPIQKPQQNEQQKAAKKDTKKPADKTKQMLDFEAKIDALRNN